MNNLNTLSNITEEFTLDNTQKKLDNLKLSIEGLSDNEKFQKKNEIQSSISSIRLELEELKKDSRVDSSKIQTIEQELTSFESDYTSFLNGIQNELDNLEDTVQSDNADDKPNWWERNKTNVLLGAGTLGVGLLVRRWWKKRKEKKEKQNQLSNTSQPSVIINNESPKKNWFRRNWGWLVGGTPGVLVWKNWERVKDFLGFGSKIGFDESISLVKGNLNNIHEKELKANIGDITYDEDSREIRSYGKDIYGDQIGTVIDKKSKKIPGIDSVTFKDYSELIFLANFINYLKYNYRGKGANNTPFYPGNLTGDIYMKIGAHINGKEDEKEVISGGLWSTLSENVPSMDSFWKSSKGKNNFLAYLNSLNIWGKQDVPIPDSNGDSVQEKVNLVMEDIYETDKQKDHKATRGQILAEKLTDTKYNIKSWSFSEKITTSPNIKIEGLNIVFPNLEEAIRVANLANKMKFEYGGKCEKDDPFSFEREYGYYGLYVNTKPSSIKERVRKIRVVSKDVLKEKYSTIY